MHTGWLSLEDKTYFLDQKTGELCTGNRIIEGKQYLLPGIGFSENVITVNIDGGADYTSFTRALYENVDTTATIVVAAGTYDIKNEYVELFGKEAVNNMADSDDQIFKGFQYGIIIRNKRIEFLPHSYIVCDWTGNTVDATHRFSPLRVDYNAEIIGLNLTSKSTFYAIHDDYGLSTTPYTVTYQNCRVEGIDLVNSNCIGGGCGYYSWHFLEDCYFTNNKTSQTVVRYHNTAGEGAQPKVYVSNCFFNSYFTPTYYGNQTSKMKVYVANSTAKKIKKEKESLSYNTDNVVLVKHNNIEIEA